MKTTEKTIAKNTTMLMLMSVARLVFPLITLPFLTRVLSIEAYAKVTYVKSCIVYVQSLLDFGFMYSATKNIVRQHSDAAAMGRTIAAVTEAKLLLGLLALMAIGVMLWKIELLQGFSTYMLLAFAAALVNSILPDYLFRGLNQMHVITYRFVACKGISVLLTILLVKGDQSILLIPALDCFSSFVAAAATYQCVKKYRIRIRLAPLRDALAALRDGFVYFFSSFASTAFNAFLTIIIGIYLNAVDVAYWGVAMQLILAAQALYSPIGDGVYPKMIETQDIRIIKNILKWMMPPICAATLLGYFLAEPILTLVGGAKYAQAAGVFQGLLPLLVFSFPTHILGWPALGAIGKEKQNTLSTIIGAGSQVVMVMLLIAANAFTLNSLIVTRVLAEVILFAVRFFFFIKYKHCFTSAASTGQNAS